MVPRHEKVCYFLFALQNRFGRDKNDFDMKRQQLGKTIDMHLFFWGSFLSLGGVIHMSWLMQYKEGERKPQHEHDANHDNKKKELGGNRTKMMEETDNEACGTFHKKEQQTYLLKNFGGWNT